MIIPVKCFTCNLVIGSKYKTYLELVKKMDTGEFKKNIESATPSENAFNLLQLNRYCCRRHLLSHTDLVDII